MIKPDIFILQTFGVLVLIVALHRIFQDSFCKIKAAVAVDVPAHEVIHPFFLCLRQIGFPKIQFHVGMGLFQCFRREYGNFVLYFTLFLHLLGDVCIFHAGHIIGKLLHVAFQRFLIHLFRKKVFPVELCQIFHGNGHHLLQGSSVTRKIRIHDSIIQFIDDPDQFHGIPGFPCTGNHLPVSGQTFFRTTIPLTGTRGFSFAL